MPREFRPSEDGSPQVLKYFTTDPLIQVNNHSKKILPKTRQKPLWMIRGNNDRNIIMQRTECFSNREENIILHRVLGKELRRICLAVGMMST